MIEHHPLQAPGQDLSQAVGRIPIREMAEAVLADLEAKLAPDVYTAAQARGAARPYDVAAKELMDSLNA